ncbi:DUF4352 domain-containing protein [Streptomyces sp. NRRL F-2664]|uniref:DUF4352 domain-containing protein n=1 Tax=Streptomyces sp. NRRL F-2664 TaxID=1463842 RepID=UPI00068E85DB|nr:DUF4352 domain-containing protein [Streptomyces sp. NRRL F-2664]
MSQQDPQQSGSEPSQPPVLDPQVPQPQKRSKGKMAGLGCLGIVALLIVMGAIASGGGSENAGTPAAKSSPPPAPVGAPKGEPAKEEKKAGPVAVTAEKTKFEKGVFADGTDYTSVLITVTNNGDKAIDVNPLFVTITDTSGTKHTAELGVDERQIATVDLAPGENVSGAVTAKGAFTPKYVTYTDGIIGESVRADVP